MNIKNAIFLCSLLAGITSYAAGSEHAAIHTNSDKGVEEYMARQETALRERFPFAHIERSGLAINMQIPPATFEHGATELFGSELENAKAIAALLLEYGNTNLSLGSYVTPGEENNKLLLNKARINFIRNLLINGGVSESRITELDTYNTPGQSAYKGHAKGYVEMRILPAKTTL